MIRVILCTMWLLVWYPIYKVVELMLNKHTLFDTAFAVLLLGLTGMIQLAFALAIQRSKS